ncbi:hypothetical protein ANO14919_008200 [Xylariales sp. No.14919]|nr:putative allantoate permease [Xylaria grammica]GAW11474.1 hypothetical protein ANO14919_008200 [Xylariales sp. No.14919]
MDNQDRETIHAGAGPVAESCFCKMVDDGILYRKIDVHIIPLIFATHMLIWLDKALINYANIMGLQEDLGLHGQQFSWAATVFPIAYIAAEFPQGMLIQKFPPTKVLGVNVFFWGIMVSSTAACQNFAGLVAVRTLLGVFEAVFIPASIMITSQWYTRRESTPRYGVWFCGLGTGQMIGGLISFAAQHGSRMTSFSSWRIMFVAVGFFNLVIATLILLLLPNTPEVAPWLSDEEKTHIREKLALDQAGTGSKVFQKMAIVEALVFDIHAWLLFALVVLIVTPSGVISTFSTALIKGFGYDSKSAALLNIPSGAVSIIATLSCTYAILIDFPRCFGIIALMIPTLIGAGLMSFYDGTGGALAGIYLINFGIAPMALVYSLAGVNTRGYTKKITVNAVITVAHGTGNIIGPQTFLSWEAPGYISAKITVFAVSGAAIFVAAALRLLYGWRNRQRIKERQAELNALSIGQIDIRTLERLGDETDVRNKAFVYVY